MKTNIKYVSLAVASAVAGAALFALSKTSFSAFFQSDLAVAATTAIAIAGFAVRDYSRRAPSLALRATVLRPALLTDTRPAVRTAAYTAKPIRSERLAA